MGIRTELNRSRVFSGSGSPPSSSSGSSSSAHAAHVVSTIFSGYVSSQLGVRLTFKAQISATCSGGPVSSRTFGIPTAIIKDPVPCEITHVSPEGEITKMTVDSVSAEYMDDEPKFDPVAKMISQRVRVTWKGRKWDPEDPRYHGDPVPYTVVSDGPPGLSPWATLACGE